MRSNSEGVIARARRARGDLDGVASGPPAPRNDWWAETLATLKRVCGMPDYQGYLAHMREKHGGCAVLSEPEYFEQHMQVRYGNGVSRCC
jgi:uncharacterized short protein YbdD (DUF466 family)